MMKGIKTSKPTTRNAARKRAYEALADSSSRNQQQLDGPIVGRLEVVHTEIVETVRRGKDGNPEIVQLERPVTPYTRVVHDDRPTSATARAVVRDSSNGFLSSDSRKAWRQKRAWGRCSHEKFADEHANCPSCGCPAGYTPEAA